MEYARYHQMIKGNFGAKQSKHLREALADVGFTSLNELVSNYIRSQVEWIKPLSSNKNPLALRSQIFLNPEVGHLIAYREPSESSRATRQGKRDGIDFLVAAQSGDAAAVQPALESAASGLGESELESGSLHEKGIATSISESLQKLSPNGKKLSEEPFLLECSKLADNDLRVDLQTLQRTFQDDLVTREMIAKIERFATRQGRLESLLARSDLVEVSFGAECTNCQEVSLVFDQREAVDALLKTAMPTCAECKKKEFAVVELYRAKRSLVDALQQGLWLEALALERVRNRTTRVWAGQMAGSDEVDAIAVFADRVLLIECKDTSFGQNEFYVARAKAENIDATEICVLTTRDVHVNVETAVKQANEGRQTYLRQRPRHYHLLSNHDASMLRSGLDKWLDGMEASVVNGWFGGVHYPQYLFDLEF